MGYDGLVSLFDLQSDRPEAVSGWSTIMEKLNQLINSKFEEISRLEVHIRLCSSYLRTKEYEEKISNIEKEINELQKGFTKLKRN
jgi:hypothetical protein